MKLVKNTKLFVDLTNIMVVHIINNEIGCFNQFVLRELCDTELPPKKKSNLHTYVTMSYHDPNHTPAFTWFL